MAYGQPDPGDGGSQAGPPAGPPPGGRGAVPPGAANPAFGRPTGISPAAQQTGQMGVELEARIGVSFLANQLVQLAGRLGIGSELGRSLHQAAGILAKAVPPGSIPPGAENALLHKLMLAARQNQGNISAMRQMQGGRAAGGAPAGIQTPPTPQPPQVPQMFSGQTGATSPEA